MIAQGIHPAAPVRLNTTAPAPAKPPQLAVPLATRSARWHPLADAPAEQLAAEVAQLHWQRSGTTVARFGFDRSSVWWCGSMAPCEHAPLDSIALRDLLAQLAR